MKKIFLIFIIICSILNVNAEDLSINSQNAIVFNLKDNNIIYEKNSNKQVYVASLTKIMTALVAIEQIDDLTEKVTITEEMLLGIYEYSKAGLQVGDIVTYEDLLYGVILPSGADCVQALEITIAGGRDEFASLMNKKASELELSNTYFSNGIGMDENNYSSAKDIAIILQTALKNETFYKIYTTKNYKMTNGLEIKATVETHNIDSSIIKGSKTGFTDAAGLCISALYEDENYKYLIVTTNANFTEGKPYHIIDAINIINYYLNNYHYIYVYNQFDTITSIPIKNGKSDNYDIKADKEIKLFLNKNINQTDLELNIKQVNNIDSENKLGDYLGTLNITYQNETIYTQDFTLKDNLTFKQDINIILIIFLTIIIILMLIYNLLLRKKIHKLIKRLKERNK